MDQQAADALVSATTDAFNKLNNNSSGTADSIVGESQSSILPDRQIFDEVQSIVELAQGGSEFPRSGIKLKDHLSEIERALIQQALAEAKGNVSQTARLLGLQRTTLIEKINKHGLSNST